VCVCLTGINRTPCVGLVDVKSSYANIIHFLTDSPPWPALYAEFDDWLYDGIVDRDHSDSNKPPVSILFADGWDLWTVLAKSSNTF